MGMGLGVSPQDAMRYQLLQAKGDLKTLSKRVEVTKESIETLEAALIPGFDAHSLALALVRTNLIQLYANLKEGEERMTYLLDAISKAESSVKPATLIHPASRGPRH